MARRGALRLLANHLQSASQRSNAIPAKLEVVVASASHKMEMRIVEAGDDPSPSSVDHAGIIGAQSHDVGLAADCHDPFAANRESLRLGPVALQGRHLGIVHDQLRCCCGIRRLGRVWAR
jgi:hypothetical protein